MANFEIRSPTPGRYTWVLVSQGRILATGATYNRRSLAEQAIVPFRMAAANAPVVDTSVPAAKTTSGRAARATGRALAKAVIKGGRAVETVVEAVTPQKAKAKPSRAGRRR